MPNAQNPSQLASSLKNVRGIKQIAKIKAAEFEIIPIANPKNGELQGYRNREDISTLPANTLVVGSQNVLTNTFGRVFSRSGYVLDGASSGLNVGIVSSYDWTTGPNGAVRNLRAGKMVSTGSGVLEVRTPTTSTGWTTILNGLNSVSFNFAPWWNNAQEINELLMVNGGQQIWDWNGAEATLASTTNSSSEIMAIATTPTAGGSGYVIGDTLTISGGTGGTVTVNSVVNGAINASDIVMVSAGSGYAANDVVYLGQANGQNGTITVNTVTGSAINTWTLTTLGYGYSVGQAVASVGSANGGQGVGAIFSISGINNGVIGTTPFNQSSAGAISLVTPGSGYSISSGISTSGGSGTGATIQILSLGGNAITIQGSQTIGQLGFYNDSNSHRLLINGQTFSYVSSTSAANSNSFLSVTPDPTTAGLTAGMIIIQAPEVTINKGTGAGGLPVTSSTSYGSWTNDLIIGANEQILVGSLINNSVYISQLNSFTSFNGTNGNGGGPFIFGAPPVGFKVQESNVYVSCKSGQWYELVYTPSVDSLSTVFGWTVYPLKTGINQGAQSQSLMCNMPNDIAFVTNEPVVRTLGRVSLNLATPQMVNLSYSIVNDISGYNFAGGAIQYENEFLYVTIPSLGIIRIYNMTNQDEGKKYFYWESPQTIPISKIMNTGDGNIYGHSAQTSDTYKLFSGSSDNGAQISAIATFPQITFGDRHKSKSFIKEYVEGYLSQTTTLTCQLLFIGSNRMTTLTKKVLGTNSAITTNVVDTTSLGKVSLGKQPIGTDLQQQSSQVLSPNFATYLTFQRTPFFKVQPIFSSLGTSQSWQVLAYGFNQQTTSEQETSITN